MANPNTFTFPGTNSPSYNPSNPWQAMIMQAFGTTNLVQGALAVHHQPLYDTISYAPGDTITEGGSHFFENVAPSPSAKTFGQTNMPKANQLPSPQAFSIFRVHMRISEDTTPADMLLIMNSLAFYLNLGGDVKYLGPAPLWWYGAGGGIAGVQSAGASTILTNGIPMRDNSLRLEIPLVIQNVMTFYAALTGAQWLGTTTPPTNTPVVLDPAGNGTTIQVLFDGFWARQIEG
jgi:hypothetical protein